MVSPTDDIEPSFDSLFTWLSIFAHSFPCAQTFLIPRTMGSYSLVYRKLLSSIICSAFPSIGQVYYVCNKFTKDYDRAMKHFRWKRLNESQTQPMPLNFWKHSKTWIDGAKNILSWIVRPIWPKILWCIMYGIYRLDDVLTIICLVAW